MGPDHTRTAASVDAETGRRIAAAGEEFPDWDIREVFGGFEAVPAGTPVIRAMFIDVLIEKLRVREAGGDDPPEPGA
jgi:hypothetical protein